MIKNSQDHLLRKLSFILDSPLTTMEEATKRMEENLEATLFPILNGLGIRASIKSDKKSLPTQNEVVRIKYFSSMFNNVLDLGVLNRMFIRELLEQGHCKIRFYVDVQPLKDVSDQYYGFNYAIRWYGHGCN